MNSHQQPPAKLCLASVALLIVLPVLFIKFDLPSPPPARIWRHLFNLSHIPLFALIAYVIWHQVIKQIENTTAALIICLVLSMLIGITIELVQSLTGRTASWNDLQLDSIGVLVFVAAGPAPRPLTKTIRRLLGSVLVIWLILKLLPLATASVDYYTLHKHPELLSDFESIGQASRWTRGAVTSVDQHNRALRVSLGTKPYEGSTLEYLPRDWTGYSVLQLDIFHADQVPANLHIKIRDSQAVIDGDHYDMQFNQVTQLVPGWNRIKLSLDEIHGGPRNRTLQLDHIHALTLFYMGRNAPGYMLLDNLRLQ